MNNISNLDELAFIANQKIHTGDTSWVFFARDGEYSLGVRRESANNDKYEACVGKSAHTSQSGFTSLLDATMWSMTEAHEKNAAIEAETSKSQLKLWL